MLLLVFYQYEEFAHIQIMAAVSSTACMPIYFNTFDIHKLCFWDNDFHCHMKLKKIVGKSGIAILFQHETDTIILETKERACAILQLYYNLENYKPIINDIIGYMKMKFQIAHSLQTKKDVLINIKGFLKGDPMIKNHNSFLRKQKLEN